MRVLPANGQSFVDFEILAGFDAAAAENALVGIIAVERVGVIDFVGFGLEWDAARISRQNPGDSVPPPGPARPFGTRRWRWAPREFLNSLN